MSNLSVSNAAPADFDWRKIFQGIIGSCPLATILTAADDGRVLEFNEALLRMSGWPREEFTGRTTKELQLWQDPKERDDLVRRLKRHGQVMGFEAHLRVASGAPTVARLHAHLLHFDGQPCILCFAEDITERVRQDERQRQVLVETESRVVDRTSALLAANEQLEREIQARRQSEEQLRESEAKWRATAQMAVDHILRVDRQGVILDVNRAMQRRRIEDLVGHHLREITPPETYEQLDRAIQGCLAGGDIQSMEVVDRDRNGDERWYLTRVGPFRRDGEITGAMIFATDITERKLAEQQLLAEEQLLRRLLDIHDRERRLITYEIHDGLLQDIVGAQMLLQAAAAAADPKSARNIQRVRDLLVAAINEGRRLISELRPMILDEMGLAEALQFLANEEEAKGTKVRLQTRDQTVGRLSPLLQATLFRIAKEAVTNARRHGQATEIEIRLTHIGKIGVVLEIQDNGCGFDPESIPEDRFGIRGICERARLFGGGATIESAPGQGTRVTVKLPLVLPRIDGSQEPLHWTWSI